MVSRKTRAKSTADRMKKYKEAADASKGHCSEARHRGRTRSSPRTKNSTPSSTGSDSRKGMRGDSAAGTRTRVQQNEDPHSSELEKRTFLRDEDIEIPETPQKKSSSAWTKNNISADRTKRSELEELAEIPQPSPRGSMRTGGKRVFAPVPAESWELAEADSAEESPRNECDRPSKKRKVFQTPPSGAIQCNELSEASPQDTVPIRSHCISRLPERLVLEDEYDDLDPPLRKGNMGNASRICTPSSRVLNERGPSRTLPSRGGDGDMLDAISTSSVTLARLFDSLRNKLLKDLESKHEEQFTALVKAVNNSSAGVVTELRDMRGVLQMLSSNSVKGLSSSRSANRTSLAEWEKKLDDMTPSVKIIFSTEVLGRIVAYNAPLKVVESFCGGQGSDAERASQALQTLLFSLQPGEKKEMYAEGIGSQHSRYKYTIVQNLFFNVCRDSFGLFRPSKTRADGPTSPSTRETLSNNGKTSAFLSGGSCDGVSTGDKCEILRPAWLRPGYVTVDHIQVARTFLETSNQSRKNKIRDTPTVNDIASHGALRVYRQVGNHFHQARENVRASFFHGIGYLLVPWSVHVTEICQSSLKMAFTEPGTETLLELDSGSIPETKVCSFNAETKTTNIADAANKQLLCNLFSQWQSMVVSVQHEVHVVNRNGAQRRHSGGSKRTLYRLIHLIDVACDVCVEYSRVGTREIFLRTHSSALQCIMIVALLFKALILQHIELCETGEIMYPDPKLVQVSGFSLKDLIPGRNTQRSMLQSRCLRMTQKEFETYNHPPEDEGDTCGNADPRTEELKCVEIQESASRGIASL